ncbi:MAG: hypothetical protein ACRDS1_04380, partial [Pseudonocardiaceae bacterium]
HISIHGECHLKLAEADHAVSYSQQSLETLDRSFARDVAMTIVGLGETYAQCTEIDEAARLLGDARGHRAEFQPWQHTAYRRCCPDTPRSRAAWSRTSRCRPWCPASCTWTSS